MSLNWNTFLTDEGLNIPNDQWSDPTTITGQSTDMPSSTATRSAGTEPSDLSNFESILNGTAGDPIFSDTLFNPNDYLFSELDVLQPFGDTIGGGGSTSESSPEPTSGITMPGNTVFPSETDMSSAALTPGSNSTASNQSPQMPSMQRIQPHRAKSFPNPTYESMFPNTMESGFVEDLTFPNGPNGRSNASKSNGESTHSKKGSLDTTLKRSKGGKADILSACWTSPLCPNHDQNGPPPDPSNCGGGCAPFLFASDGTLPNTSITASLPSRDILEDIPETEGIVEIKPRPKKRSESESSGEPSGRTFPSRTPESQPRLKSETTDNSPEAVPAEDPSKPKGGRRRLPHNQVERKYRESLNTQLDSLKRVVPALQQKNPCDGGGDIEDLPTPSKPSKAVILASATAYIKQMEKEKKQMAEENQLLRQRVKQLQALVKCEDCNLMQYVMGLNLKGRTAEATI